MHLGRKLLTCFAVLCSLALLGPATAFASGGGNGCSAGDNQYVDPLGGSCNNTPGGSHHHHSGGSNPGSGNSGSTNPGTTTTPSSGNTTSDVSTTTSSTTSQSSRTAADPAKSKTLPFTGLDVWPCVALGIGLIGSGVALRRTSRIPRPVRR